MANQKHVKWLREGVETWNKKREEEDFIPDLSGANLRSADLSGAKLRDADLSGAKLCDASLIDTHLVHAKLRDADLSGAKLCDADLRGADLHGAGLINAKLNSADLIDANLRDADLRSADLHDANLRDADLRDADLFGSNLSGANLSGSNLSDATISNTDLSDADFSFTNLSGANLLNANLSGADLRQADLSGANLSYSESWKAELYSPSTDNGTIQSAAGEAQEKNKKKIKSIECLLEKYRGLRDKYKNKKHSDNILFYFRGESRIFQRESRTLRELRPSVMRPSPEGEFPLRAWEGDMLLDLMSRQPEAFNGLTLAIDQLVLAQHHELKTRLLDTTRNPLVALFNVCKKYDTQNGSDSEDGRLHVFAVPRNMVKPFNSDSISIIANFSKLRRSEQNLLLGKKLGPPDPKDEPPASDYAEVMGRLYNFIRHEKPSFQEKIDPRDLFRVFVVEPQRSFERIRAQSGAFLVSAFHERFERDKILEWNDGIPVYDYYTLTVSGESKKCIMDELRLLNITHESLFPGLDEAAEAVIQRFSSKKLANS